MLSVIVNVLTVLECLNICDQTASIFVQQVLLQNDELIMPLLYLRLIIKQL